MKIPRKVMICGLPYRIAIVPMGARGPKGWEKLYEGMCDVESSTIYLSARLRRNPSRLLDALVHEMAHAIAEGTGVRRWLSSLVPWKQRKTDRVFELEEDCVRMITPALIVALQSAGLIVIPS